MAEKIQPLWPNVCEPGRGHASNASVVARREMIVLLLRF